jgi:peptidase E
MDAVNRSNFIYEENEEFKNIDIEVEQINAKNNSIEVEIQQPLGKAVGGGRTKFLNQTQKNQPQKKMIISKDKVAYGNGSA